MKILKVLVSIILLVSFSSYAQEKLDEIPTIKGGIKQLAKNIKYPKTAKEAGIMGKVLVKVQIDEYGAVTETEIIDGINEDLDAAAIKAIEATKFNPGIKDSRKVKSEVTIPIKFKLDKKKKK